MLPETMTDLFAGQDLVLLARYEGSGPTHLRFSGRTAAGPVSWTSDVVFPDRERANPFVARLWATQRIGYLEAARHKSGPSAELDTELRSLGERFGIPTELTSYLVREPVVASTPLPPGPQFGLGGNVPAGVVGGAVSPQPYSGPTRRIVAHAVYAESQTPVSSAAVVATGTTSGANTRDDGAATIDVPVNATSVTVRRIGYLAQTIPLAPGQTDYTADLKKDVLRLETQAVTGVATQSAASMPAPSPTAAFAQAKAAAALRAVTTLAVADSATTLAVGAGDARPGVVQHAGDRTFVQYDGVWTDTRFHTGIRVVRVQAFSAAYFALLQGVPDLRTAFAVGERVIVAGHAVAVEVTPEGVAQLSDSDVTTVQSAW
jgi:hypothetical protein